MIIRLVAFGLFLALLVAPPATAQDFQKGLAALKQADYATALKEWRPLAERGHADAQFYMGVLYEYGRGVKKDIVKAVQWYRKAAGNGHDNAKFQLGLIALNRGDFASARKEWRPLVRKGHARALFYMGVMYQYGKGVKEDIVEAVKWYRKAADSGYVTAQYQLGLLYQHGKGVAQDYAEAAKLIRKAALQGNAKAQRLLGGYYGKGLGVPKDFETAFMWLDIGSHKNPNINEEMRNKFATFLTPSQFKNAQYRARICVATNYKLCD